MTQKIVMEMNWLSLNLISKINNSIVQMIKEVLENNLNDHLKEDKTMSNNINDITAKT